MPTRSMSGVRIHFWQVVTRLRGGVISPVKYFFIGAIPLLISRRLLSSFGTREKLGSLKQPFDSKNERNFSLNSLSPVHCIIYSPFYFEQQFTRKCFVQIKTAPYKNMGQEFPAVPPKLTQTSALSNHRITSL